MKFQEAPPPLGFKPISIFELSFSDNGRHRLLIKMLVRDGEELNGTMVNENNIPIFSLRNQGRITASSLILLPKVMRFLLNYLYTGCNTGFPSYPSNHEIPKYRSEDDYIFKHIKREIGRGEDVFSSEEQDGLSGVRIKAHYPYGSIDYGFYPHTAQEMLAMLEEVIPAEFNGAVCEIPDQQNHSLPIELRDLDEGKYLDSVFCDKKIPTNTIVDKTICGVGATYMEINAPRPSIIIEPNIPVIIGKKQQHPQIITVFGEKITAQGIALQLRAQKDSYFKIVTTPDSFAKVTKAIKSVYPNYKEVVFLLFDECEKFVSDIDFRKNMGLPIDDFFAFKNKAMVSATPIVINDPRFDAQNFKIIKINPQFDYRKKLILRPTNNVRLMLKRVLDKLDVAATPVCIFYNSVKGIENLIVDLKIVDQANIYCSTEAKKTLKGAKYKVFDMVVDAEGNSNLNSINFFTSRFYSAVDIELSSKPTIIMLSDVHRRKSSDAPYTLIDPETEAIQIVGRFRNGVSNIIHITNTNPQMGYLLKEDLERFLLEEHMGYQSQIALLKQAKTQGEQHILEQSISRSDYKAQGFVTDKDEINYFRYNKAYQDERIKLQYRYPAILNKAYRRSKAFVVYSESEYMLYTEQERQMLKDKNRPKSERIQLLYELYCRLNDSAGLMGAMLKEEFMAEYGLYLDAFKEIGFSKVKELKCVDSEVRTCLKTTKFERLTKSSEVIADVYNVLQPNTVYPTIDINTHLKKVYDRYGIEYDKRGIGKNISSYFDAREERTGLLRSWQLGAKKY